MTSGDGLLAGVDLRQRVPLAPLTTLRTGGAASVLLELRDTASFPEVVAHARRLGVTLAALGGGSNVLVADAGAPAVLLVRTGGITMTRDHDRGVVVTVEAGHSWQELVDATVAEGLVGMERLTGIPGTTGATPIQNVGAYGQEVADTLVSVQAWDWQQDRPVTIPAAACRFGYRTSLFKRAPRWTVLRVTFRLTPSDLSAPIRYPQLERALGAPAGARLPLAAVTEAVLALRRERGNVIDPADPETRSVGSVFLGATIDPADAEPFRRRGAPVRSYRDGTTRVSASWLLQAAGFTLGEVLGPGVRVSRRNHTLIAGEGATTTAFVAGLATMCRRVREATGLVLTPEPDPIGDDPAYRELITATSRLALAPPRARDMGAARR